MHYPGFIGPTNVMASVTADTERTINWYYEPTSPGTGKVPGWLRPTPGLAPFVVLNSGPVTRIFVQDGRGFAIGGTELHEVYASRTVTGRGFVAVAGRAPTIATNGTAGNQLFITSGGAGYIFDLVTNVLTAIADVDFLTPSIGGAFSDGYFINLKGNSRTFQISALEDGTTWDALDVFEISTASDNILAMVVAHREIWLLGSQTAQVWANVGDPDIPFQPVPGSLMQQGIWAPDSLLVVGNTVYWLGQSQRGVNVVYRADGYHPQRVSTHAIETYLRRQERTEDAIGWTYEQDGHSFYVLYGPTWETTLVLDITTGQWHERALWDPVMMRWTPHLGRCAQFGFGAVLVGDRSSQAIYSLDPTVFTDGQVV